MTDLVVPPQSAPPTATIGPSAEPGSAPPAGAAPSRAGYSLADRFGAGVEPVVLTGMQALTRVLIDRVRLDARAGLRTAGLTSGYPGSPLGGLDLALHRAEAELSAAGVRHVPGVNEELAAAVVFGTQQPPPGGFRDGLQGVFGMWYGKAPGVDRSGDAFKHANYFGTHPHGGVLVVAGDDPAAKSSSLPNESETAFYDALIPVLVPGSTQELLDFGLLGLELSRFCGCWVGMKVVTSVADSVGTVEVDPDRFDVVRPPVLIDGEPWRHEQRLVMTATILLDRERDLLEQRHHAAVAFAAANGINRIEGATTAGRIGIVAAGKTYLDTVAALRKLGIGPDDLDAAGVRLLKLGMIYPLDPSIVADFAQGLDTIVVVEEKRDFVESAVRNALYPTGLRPAVLGKRDAHGAALIPAWGELDVDKLVPLLARALDVPAPAQPAPLTRRPLALPLLSRTSAYCSGCPHNRSTVLPDGAVMGGGVGCHGMSYMDPRLAANEKLSVVPMGSEGVPWIGLAPFANTGHMFQNLGDGTFTHSGLLAVRACVAAGVNITFKLLYNGFVAMTGGQQIAGGMSVAAITRELEAEGVARIVVCADDLSRYRGRRRAKGLAPGVRVVGRDRLEAEQEALQDVPGVTVLIYDQVCAAEARRLRRTGVLPTPTKRVVINEAVCEGCGDCGAKSNCLSVQPVDTALGRKTQIHQTSCNSDYSCLAGDCPSFVTVTTRPDANRRRRRSAPRPAREMPAEPVSKARVGDTPYGIYLIGVGGTGVVTVNQVLAAAALLDGLHTTGMDQTGMSQKAGAVVSHLQISTSPSTGPATVTAGGADLVLGFDLLTTAGDQHLARVDRDRTRLVVSTALTPTSAVVTDVGRSMPPTADLLDRVGERVAPGRLVALDAAAIAAQALGNEVTANVVLLGAAYQAGAVPLSAASIERAIELNGVAVQDNLAAFRAGRAHATLPPTAGADRPAPPASRIGSSALDPSATARTTVAPLLDRLALPAEVAEVAGVRAAELVDFQGERTAARYLDAVARLTAAEQGRLGSTDISAHAAGQLFKLMAYKDEYEVARLHLKAAIAAQAEQEWGEVKLAYHLHPPVLRALGLRRKLVLRDSLVRPAFQALAAMRGLRGTPFDPFGRAEVRRVERSLPGEYVDALLTALSADSADTPTITQRAGRIARAAEQVRGYESIKLAGVERFRAELDPARAGAPVA